MIQMGLEQGLTLQAIACSVRRSPSTITRELACNGWTCPAARPRKRGRLPIAGGYRAAAAQERARRLAAMPRCPARLAMAGPLWPIVTDMLRQRYYSPEQIAGILARRHPDAATRQVSDEPIYTALCAMPRGALRSELIACLRQYFPKGADLSRFTQAELDAIAWQLNTRPRKSLGWQCPAELFLPDFSFERYLHQLVALQA